MGLGQPHCCAFWFLVLASLAVKSGFFLLVHVVLDTCPITELWLHDSDGPSPPPSPRKWARKPLLLLSERTVQGSFDQTLCPCLPLPEEPGGVKSVSFRCRVFGGFGGDRNLISCRKEAGESPGILAGLLPIPGFVR